VTRELVGAAALAAALVLVEAAIPHGGHAPLGAFAAVGVAGSLVLGFGAKALGAWLQRPTADGQDDNQWEDEP
jgi:hypothetical protein